MASTLGRFFPTGLFRRCAILPPMTPAFDLDRALDVLATAVARPAAPDRLVLARHADFWRFSLGLALGPVDATLPFAALCADGRALVGLLVETATTEPSMRPSAVMGAMSP